MISLTVNGHSSSTDAATLDAYLASIGADARAIAVERNGEIVPRRLYADTGLDEGDRLEIVRITGGG